MLRGFCAPQHYRQATGKGGCLQLARGACKLQNQGCQYRKLQSPGYVACWPWCAFVRCALYMHAAMMPCADRRLVWREGEGSRGGELRAGHVGGGKIKRVSAGAGSLKKLSQAGACPLSIRTLHFAILEFSTENASSMLLVSSKNTHAAHATGNCGLVTGPPNKGSLIMLFNRGRGGQAGTHALCSFRPCCQLSIVHFSYIHN
jgi:hypothetical protein